MALCTVRSRGEILIAGMPGSIDHVAALTLENELRELMARQPKTLFCDFSETKYVSSSALRICHATAKKAKASGIQFGIFGLTPFVDHIFSMAGFTALFSIYDTEDAAVRAVSHDTSGSSP